MEPKMNDQAKDDLEILEQIMAIASSMKIMGEMIEDSQNLNNTWALGTGITAMSEKIVRCYEAALEVRANRRRSIPPEPLHEVSGGVH